MGGKAVFCTGFSECFRFVLYPSKKEYERNPEIKGLLKLETSRKGKAYTVDFVKEIAGGIGYFGINVHRCKGEERPTALINVVEARRRYFQLRPTLRRRYKNWDEIGLRFLEEQLREMGFKRVAIIPSTDRVFKERAKDVPLPPKSVVEKYYKQLPESQGYVKKNLEVKFRTHAQTITTKKMEYYVKELN